MLSEKQTSSPAFVRKSHPRIRSNLLSASKTRASIPSMTLWLVNYGRRISFRKTERDVSNDPLAVVVTHFIADRAGTAPVGRHLLWIKGGVLPLSKRTCRRRMSLWSCTVLTIIIVVRTRLGCMVLFVVFGVGNIIGIFIATVMSSVSNHLFIIFVCIRDRGWSLS